MCFFNWLWQEIETKVYLSNNKAVVSYSSSVTDRTDCRDSWGSVHKNISRLLIFLGFGQTHSVLWSFSVPISGVMQQLSLPLSPFWSRLEWVRSRKGKKKNFGSACGIMWKLKPQATLWSLKSHFTAQIADGWVCEGIKDGEEGERREGVNEREGK